MAPPDALQELKERMRLELDGELFFFPSRWGVQGFDGDGLVWFIAQKPSSSGFPTRHDELFYRTLRDHGFANAHLTDVSKVVGKAVDELAQEELEQTRPYFEEEIAILQPKLFVTVGEAAKRALDRFDVAPTVERNHVRHYSWASRWGKESEFDRDVAQIAAVAEARGIHDSCRGDDERELN